MAVDVALAETLVQIQSQIPGAYKVLPNADPIDIWQGEVASVRTGKTGAEVCKFVLGTEPDAQLVMLQRQPGHRLSGLIHTAIEYQHHPNASYHKHRYKFDNGQPITPETADTILLGLAERRKKKLQALATLGLGA